MNYDPHSLFARGRDVPRLHRPDPEVFARGFRDHHTPVVLTGVMDRWPCLTRWTNGYLKKTAGHHTVNLSQARHGIHFDRDQTTVPIFKSIAEYLEMIESGNLADGSLYAGNIPLRETVPELWDDIHYPPYFDPALRVPPNLWIGPGGNVVPLHFDFTHNFLAQVRGRKTVLLFPPQDSRYLFPFPIHHRSFHFSQTNIAHPEAAHLRLMNKARCSVVHLAPGEMLYIPLFWWHGVFGYGENISVNYWWRSERKVHFDRPWHESGIQYRKLKRFARNTRNRLFPKPDPHAHG